MDAAEWKNIADKSYHKPIVLESGIYDLKGEVIYANEGIVIDKPETVLCNATVLGTVILKGNNALLQNCVIKTKRIGVEINGENISLRNSRIEAKEGVSVKPGSTNVLIAQNNISGNVKVTGAVNCAIVLNQARELEICDSQSVAVSDCTLEEKVILKNNDYLICNGNSAMTFETYGNRNTNGDNITDTYARPEHGVNESILPHINKELFFGMLPKRTVRDVTYDEPLDFNSYIRREAEKKSVVIVPPGVYDVDEALIIEADHSNTKIYAYGVYHEKKEYGNVLSIKQAENVEIYGLTSGYKGKSCGQGYVLKVIDERRFWLVPGAGWPNDFGKSNLSLYHRAEVNTYRQGIAYPWGDLGVYEIRRLDNGLLEIMLDEGRSPMVGRIEKGDVLSCRLAGNNSNSIELSDASNVLLRDCVLYGYAAALAILGYGNTTNARIERWTDTVKAAPIIDEATYLRYKALEKEYGINLEISIDSKGRYRGAVPRTGSVDATHFSGARQGLSATSCILECMCDDGTNQRASSARLASLIDNGDGTTTIQYKGCATSIYYSLDPDPKGRCFTCSPFRCGDHIYIYASNGKTVCDTHTLTETVQIGSVDFNITEPPHSKDYTAKIFEVKVPTADVNFSAVEGYDLSDNHYDVKNKAFVDNLDRNSANYTFDNVLMQNARSRCALIKTSGVTICNCTFRNMLHTGILFSAEPGWGESSIAKDTVVERCIFDHTGYRNHDFKTRRWSPIVIMGLSSAVSEDSLLYKNITIKGNKFVNTTHECFAWITAAQKVRIENNIFERAEDSVYKDHALVLEADTVMDIVLKGNTYPVNSAFAGEIVNAVNFKNIIVEDEILDGEIE